MNKRMRKLLVSLGMVVTLGSGSAFATGGTLTGIGSASELKTLMDKADDYIIFANTALTQSDVRGSIAANQATITGTKIGLNGQKLTNGKVGNDISFIYKLTDNTMEYPFQAKHTVVLDEKLNTIIPKWNNNQGYKLIKEDNSSLPLSNNDSDLTVKCISPNGLGKEGSPASITDVLNNLKVVQRRLAISETTKLIKVENISWTELKSSGYKYFDLVDTDKDDNYGVTVVNVVIPEGTTMFEITNGIKFNLVDKNDPTKKTQVAADWDTNSGKVIFNFVTGEIIEGKITKAAPYEGTITTAGHDSMGIFLAPAADVKIGTGNHDGAIICDEFLGNGAQMHQVELELVDKEDNGFKDEDYYIRQEEMGDSLKWGAIAVVGVAASGLFLVNRKDEDEE